MTSFPSRLMSHPLPRQLDNSSERSIEPKARVLGPALSLTLWVTWDSPPTLWTPVTSSLKGEIWDKAIASSLESFQTLMFSDFRAITRRQKGHRHWYGTTLCHITWLLSLEPGGRHSQCSLPQLFLGSRSDLSWVTKVMSGLNCFCFGNTSLAVCQKHPGLSKNVGWKNLWSGPSFSIDLETDVWVTLRRHYTDSCLRGTYESARVSSSHSNLALCSWEDYRTE